MVIQVELVADKSTCVRNYMLNGRLFGAICQSELNTYSQLLLKEIYQLALRAIGTFEPIQLVRTDIESQCFLLARAQGLCQSIKDDRKEHDTQAGLQTLARVGLGEPYKDFPSNATTAN